MSPARTRRPSPLANLGNPAAAAPDDEPTAAPATSKATPAPAAPAAPETVQDSKTAATPAKTRARATKRAPATSGRSKTTRSSRSAAGAPAAAAAPAAPAGAEPPAAETPSSRPGRPRIPKPGPITRATVDLAQTEQRELERITGVIGRKIGRDSGRKRVQVQHLMRVATRRLISDAAFRDLVAEDLAEHRDELKREK
ncbi:hypothetical protein Ae406Ps2_6332 [Pseudonocardia sp. Ae406_Ps2]|uniref:hypothetical protein n=1 Tax=unclassified Pseudonocardia TaxID=2619320 RepID=UPI00094AA01A|nr:hypothetical protein [Pseudonocardia sp. Ae406_Ps2]OLL89942.1 hypothetical protein Ae406Ps2_6332 [Pseudonocardia sp. Ae406_Ps2]